MVAGQVKLNTVTEIAGQESEYESYSRTLDTELSMLFEGAQELAKRLDPVIKPVPYGQSNGDKPDEKSLSPVADALCRQAQNARQSGILIRSLIERLAI